MYYLTKQNNRYSIQFDLKDDDNCLFKSENILDVTKFYSKINKILKIYTDGSCIHNGKPNAKAGIGIYIPQLNIKISERIKGKQTNNTAELKAIIKACSFIDETYSYVEIYTDSKYCILCCTSYGLKNHKIGWKKNISNKELVKKIFNIFNNNKNIKIKHIKAHTNNDDEDSIGNSFADKLANLSIVVD